MPHLHTSSTFTPPGGASPTRAFVRPPHIKNVHVASGSLFQAHPVSVSPGIDLPSSPTIGTPSMLLTFCYWITHLVHRLGGLLARLQPSVTPTPPSTLFYQPTPSMILAGEPRLASRHRHADAASRRILLDHPVGAPFGNGLATPPYVFNSFCTSRHLLRAHPVAESSESVPCHTSQGRQRPRYLWPSPIGAPGWCITREGALPCLPTSARIHSLRYSPTDVPRWCLSGEGTLPCRPPSARIRYRRSSPLDTPRRCLSYEGPFHISLPRQRPRPQVMHFLRGPL